jgi:hypothetical protein
MALFRDFGVNRRNRLCGIQEYASAQFLDFLELAKNCTFLDRKRISALYKTADGHLLTPGTVKLWELPGRSWGVTTDYDEDEKWV